MDDEVYHKIDLIEGSHAYTISFSKKEIMHVKIIQITELQYGFFQLEDIRVDGEISKWDKPHESILWIGDSFICRIRFRIRYYTTGIQYTL